MEEGEGEEEGEEGEVGEGELEGFEEGAGEDKGCPPILGGHGLVPLRSSGRGLVVG